MRRMTGMLVGGCVVVMAGCSTYGGVPPDLQSRVDRQVTFVQLKENPSTYQGRVMAVGGIVLSARLTKDATRIEILQLPENTHWEPGGDLRASEGRLLAFQRDGLDPAVLPPGTRVTVVGEITGALTVPLDDVEYRYPTLDVKWLTVWPKFSQTPTYSSYPYGGFYWGPYWGPMFRSR